MFIQQSASPRLDNDQAGFTVDLKDMEIATVGGTVLGVSTLAGAAAIGTVVMPAQVIGGVAIAGTLIVAGQVKKDTGSYLPFLRKADPTVDEAMTKKETKKSASKVKTVTKQEAPEDQVPAVVTNLKGVEIDIDSL